MFQVDGYRTSTFVDKFLRICRPVRICLNNFLFQKFFDLKNCCFWFNVLQNVPLQLIKQILLVLRPLHHLHTLYFANNKCAHVYHNNYTWLSCVSHANRDQVFRFRCGRHSLDCFTAKCSSFVSCTSLPEPGETTVNKSPRGCLLYTSPSPRDRQKSRMPSSA